MSKPVKVGVTGGIGSGKSIVCKIFSLLGIPVYDADSQAKRLMVSDPRLMQGVRDLFGEDAYQRGRLNRSYIAARTFQDEQLLEKLNKLVHPAVGRDFDQWCASLDTLYVIEEAALLIETGAHRKLDYLINVEAPVELRIKRVLERDPHRDKKQVQDIIKRQITDQERRKEADMTIVNDGRNMVIPAVLEADKLLRRLRQ